MSARPFTPAEILRSNLTSSPLHANVTACSSSLAQTSATVSPNSSRGLLARFAPQLATSLRKSFVRSVYDASGHDLIRTQRIVGHHSPIVTARYLETTDSELDDLVLSLSPTQAPTSIPAIAATLETRAAA